MPSQPDHLHHRRHIHLGEKQQIPFLPTEEVYIGEVNVETRRANQALTAPPG